MTVARRRGSWFETDLVVPLSIFAELPRRTCPSS